MSIFGDNIKRLRKNKGLTQQEIADLVHVNRVTYTNWEKESLAMKILLS